MLRAVGSSGNLPEDELVATSGEDGGRELKVVSTLVDRSIVTSEGRQPSSDARKSKHRGYVVLP